MALPVLNPNNVHVYNVSGYAHKNLPDWLVKKHQKSLKNDAEWGRRIELLQDFDFPEASLRVKTSRDGRFIVATGVYKPQIRVYELADMAMKFDRHTSAENIQFEILSEDWTKLVLLQSDRTIEFHAQGGIHYSTRIPKMGRDMVYDYATCDLIIGASSSEVYRLNLDRGQFMKPFEVISSAINTCKIAPMHSLYGFGGDEGQVEFFDPRDRNRVGLLQINPTFFDLNNSLKNQFEISALHFLPDGLSWAAGTSTGHVLLFDLRSSKPVLVKDHHYGAPIKNIDYHYASENLMSSDKRGVKFWNRNSGELLTSVEPGVDINDVCMQQGTGFFITAVEDPKIQSFYIPAIGPAPRWASFIDNLTEEMEEDAASRAAVYDNYKFVVRSELVSLGLDHLIGTSVLRAYMHGFFVDLRLYEKAKAIANPFAYEEFITKQRQAKLEKEQASRIAAKDTAKLPKVNKNLAIKLGNSSTRKSKASVNGEGIVADIDTQATPDKDPRFKELFTNPDFEIDEESHEFHLLHPSTTPVGKNRGKPTHKKRR